MTDDAMIRGLLGEADDVLQQALHLIERGEASARLRVIESRVRAAVLILEGAREVADDEPA